MHSLPTHPQAHREPVFPLPWREDLAGSDGLHCSEGWEALQERRGRNEEGREGEREGSGEETRCQRQARKDVTGLMRREEGGIGKRGWGGHGWESVRFCRQHGSDQTGEPGMMEAPGSGGKAGTGQQGRRAGKMETT